MSIKQKPVYICDSCGAELTGEPGITTEAVANEGCSEIKTVKGASWCIDDAHYCDFDCFVTEAKRHLGKDI